MVTLTIDGKTIKVPEGTTLLKAAEQAGVEIPHLCAEEGIHPYGACRVCTVEVTENQRTRLQASCTYPVSEGLVVRTDTPKVLNGRKVILELLLARCPEVKAIKDFAKKWGAPKTRFTAEKTDDCILCGLCVRACRDVVGAEALTFAGRGIARVVDTPFGYHPDACVGCGLCTFVCPTGKMQMESITAEILRRKPGTEKSCRYQLMGMVSSKTCPENIDCAVCPYDQMMETVHPAHPALTAKRKEQESQMRSGPFILEPKNSYSANHTWVKGINGVYIVGVDHFTAALLPTLEEVRVEDGKIILKGGGKKLSLDIPIEGQLLRVNPQLEAVPGLVNFSPYHRGWIAVIKTASKPAGFYNGIEALRWMDKETEKLAAKKMLNGLSLDSKEISGNWNTLAKEFFKAVS